MKFVIFHGAFGNKNGNWFAYLKTELIKLKQDVILEQFPVDDWNDIIRKGPNNKTTNQSLNSWLQVFEKKILPNLDKNEQLCFIGHSLGPVFILHIVNKFDIQLDSAIFVQPFMRSLKQKEAWPFDVVNATFYKTDFNFNKLKKLIPTSYVIYSDNDQFVKPEFPLEFAKEIGSSIVLIKGAKHINADSGFTKLPLVLELCKSRLDPSI